MRFILDDPLAFTLVEDRFERSLLSDDPMSTMPDATFRTATYSLRVCRLSNTSPPARCAPRLRLPAQAMTISLAFAHLLHARLLRTLCSILSFLPPLIARSNHRRVPCLLLDFPGPQLPLTCSARLALLRLEPTRLLDAHFPRILFACPPTCRTRRLKVRPCSHYRPIVRIILA